MESQDEAINELEGIYQEKFLRHLDKRIPLHGVTDAMARLAIARLRVQASPSTGPSHGWQGCVFDQEGGRFALRLSRHLAGAVQLRHSQQIFITSVYPLDSLVPDGRLHLHS